MTTEDHCVRPVVANEVRSRVGGQRGEPVRSGERGEDQVVLGGLLPDLPPDDPKVLQRSAIRLLAGTKLLRLEVVQRHAPLEKRCEKEVVGRISDVPPFPRLVTRDTEDAIAHVVVHADDVRVLVVHKIVRMLPLHARTGGVPLPRRRVDLGIVHPIPLPVHHVVAELHVLDDLGDAEHPGPENPCGLAVAEHEHHAPARGERTLKCDGASNVFRVGDPPRFLDVTSDRVEFGT